MNLLSAVESSARACSRCSGLYLRRGLRARHRKLVCSSAEPDRNTQEALVDMVRENIRARQQRVDQVDGVAKDERAKLQQTADELREELDNASKLNKARRDLAFGAAQADINQKYDELEAELRKSREELEADQADLDAFQEKLMHDRQRGLFFKSLYTDPKVVKRMRARRGQHAVTPEAELLQQQQARQEDTRAVRRRLLLTLAVISMGACVSDILIGSSQTWQALLYAAITISIVLTVAAEQVAHRDMQKELQGPQPMDSSDELR